MAAERSEGLFRSLRNVGIRVGAQALQLRYRPLVARSSQKVRDVPTDACVVVGKEFDKGGHHDANRRRIDLQGFVDGNESAHAFRDVHLLKQRENGRRNRESVRIN